VSAEPETLTTSPWNDPAFTTPDDILAVTAMLSRREKRMLFWLALNYYSRAGAVVDLGAYLGGSAICLAAGLRAQGVTDRVLHSYDLFKLGAYELERDFPDGAPPGNSTRSIFDANLMAYADLLATHEGDLLEQRWDGSDVEILFVDIAKSSASWDHVVEQFFPALIPGRSVVVMQDYLFERGGPWHQVVMEHLQDQLRYLVDAEYGSALFLNTRKVTEEDVASARWDNISESERVRLMHQAIERMDTEPKRMMLEGALELLESGEADTWGSYHRLT
jgi:hypothetical protein